jgi:hypothetical protein
MKRRPFQALFKEKTLEKKKKQVPLVFLNKGNPTVIFLKLFL